MTFLSVRSGHVLAGGKSDTILAVDGDRAQEAQQTQRKAITQTFSPPSGNWSQPLRTETISRFNFFFISFILTLSPCGCCTAGVELYSEVFQKEGKVFLSDAQTGAAWLIVK